MILRCQAPGTQRGKLCNTPIGESPYNVELVGVVRRYEDRDRAENGRRDIRKCPRCRWVNIYRPAAGLQVDTQEVRA